MQFTMTIDCDGAAFEGENLDLEIERILGDIADKVVYHEYHLGHSKTVLDSNGNDVGRWRIGKERS